MRELIKTYEAWDPTSNQFDRAITVWKEGDNYFQAKYSQPADSVDLGSLSSTPIPFYETLGCSFHRSTSIHQK
jgi:hypothetical protein